LSLLHEPTNRIATCSFREACVSQDHPEECPFEEDPLVYSNSLFCKETDVDLYRQQPFQTIINYPCSSGIEKCFKTPSILCSDFKTCGMYDRVCTCLNDEVNECKLLLQCDNGGLLLAANFCDNFYDCDDFSDEIRNQPGFKCSPATCILPQRNLYDNVSHCADGSDLCFNGNNTCFECFDKRHLISKKQICDGIIDCYDLSDECLCETNLYKEICMLLADSLRNEQISSIGHSTANLGQISSIIETNNKISLAQLLDAISSSESARKTCQSKYGNIYPRM